MTTIKIKRVGPNYRSEDGRFQIKHTGTAGRSTRVFTAYDGDRYITSGGLMKCRAAIQNLAN